MSEQTEEVIKSPEKVDLSNEKNEFIDLNGVNLGQEEFTFSKSMKSLIHKNSTVTDAPETLEIFKQDNENLDWVTTDHLEVVLDNETMPIEINNGVTKECCFPTCFNNQTTVPEKSFYALPASKSELNSWLAEFDLHLPDENNSHNLYYICGDHIATPETSIASKNNQTCPLANGLSSLTVSEVDDNDLKTINGNYIYNCFHYCYFI